MITIEPDSNEHGELGGGKVVRMKRRLCPAAGDRFVRWAHMDRRAPLNREAMYLPSKREAYLYEGVVSEWFAKATQSEWVE